MRTEYLGMEKRYDSHFRAYRSDTKEFIGEYHWLDITPKEFNYKLCNEVYKTPFYEHLVTLNWI